jgi:hypothetical protein
MVRIAAGQRYRADADANGIEIFVVSGSIRCVDDVLPAESWLRFPGHHAVELSALEGCVLWVKRGHLPTLG